MWGREVAYTLVTTERAACDIADEFETGVFESMRIRVLRKMRNASLMLAVSLVAAGTLAPGLSGDDVQPDPWSKGDLLEPASLAKVLTSSATPPTIICVAFPVLYRQRHILHARFAGPTSKPEGLKVLREAVDTLPRSSEIVIYCGCCPMDKCPNIRPAYRMLKELGFSRVRVLDLPTNFHTDWSGKGYPVE